MSSKNKRARVRCQCGKTEIAFRNYQSVYRLECACFSCRQRHEWQYVHGSPIGEYNAPVNITYLSNAVTSIVGEGHLRTYKLREKTDTTWLATACCHSVMALSNSVAYRGNIVGIPGDIVDCDEVPCRARIQTQAWAPNINALPPFKGQGPIVTGRHIIPMLWWLISTGFIFKMYTKPDREDGDRSIEEIMGSSPIILGIKEYEHITSP